MELLVILIVGSPIVFAIWVAVRLVGDRSQINSLKSQVERLEEQFARLPHGAAPTSPPEPATTDAAQTGASAPIEPSVHAAEPIFSEPPVTPPPPEPIAVPPPLPVMASVASIDAVPAAEASKPAASAPPALSKINWEDFLGIKLFAWIGAVLLFLVVGFFIKYSFERNLITPAMRIAMGCAAGTGLLVTALRMNRERFAVTVQALASASILIFYGCAFSSHALYGFIGLNTAFTLMSVITVGAFALAVGMRAQAVAVIGLAGGFLTPVLLSSGEDRPGALFSYIALLDVGLIAVALRQRWSYMVALGWLGTIAMQFGWWMAFYVPGKLGTAVTVNLLFSAVFLGAHLAATARRVADKFTFLPALLASGAALVFGIAETSGGDPSPFARHPVGLLLYALAAGAGWIVLSRLQREHRVLHLAAAIAASTLVLVGSLSSGRSDPGALLNAHLGLAAAFVALHAWMLHRFRDDRFAAWSGVVACGTAMLFALLLVVSTATPALPPLHRFFPFLFTVDALLLLLASQRPRWRPIHMAAGSAMFAILAVWTTRHLTPGTLGWLLGVATLFCLLHTAYPVVLERFLPGRKPVWWAQLFPLLSIALVAMPVLKLATGSTLLWPVLLILVAAGFLLAVATRSSLGMIALSIAALGVCGLWMFRLPMNPARLTEIVVILGGFSAVLCAGAVWFGRRPTNRPADGAWASDPISAGLRTNFAALEEHLPALPAALPFLLLSLLVASMPMASATPVFLLAAGLGVLLLGLARVFRTDALCAVGLGATVLLELIWRSHNAGLAAPAHALTWHLVFATLYFAFPFVFRSALRNRTLPWMVSAAAFPLHFQFLYAAARAQWETSIPGWIPAALAVPPLVALLFLARALPAGMSGRNSILAAYGGAVSLFVTFIFPIQFDNQWLTIGWALQGAAKLWLFRRIPHRGLKYAGTVLLCVAFARLAMNPTVLEYAPRSGTILWNWFLYAYGTVAACLFVGARLLAPQEARWGRLNVRALFATLGTVLLFLLMNIEIADAFSAGERIRFELSGNFGRDMAYSLGWTLFAVALLVAGFLRTLPAARWAGLVLISATILKLAFHDLWQLGGLYRIGSLGVMAVALILISFGYQKLRGAAGRPPSIGTATDA